VLGLVFNGYVLTQAFSDGLNLRGPQGQQGHEQAHEREISVVAAFSVISFGLILEEDLLR